MKEFYLKRQQKHRQSMMKYLKYILNDHFLLVMLISMGGFGLYYSEFIKTIPEDFVLGKVVGILFCVLTLFVGKVATLIKEADSIFVLPKERQMIHYFKEGLLRSIVLPFVVLTLVTGIMMPLLVATSSLEFTDFYPILLTLWVLKLGHLMLQVANLYLNTDKSIKLMSFIWLAASVTTMVVNVLIMPWLGLPIAIIVVGIIYVQSKKMVEANPLDWEKAITLERKRMKKIYSFINLFTDVPGLSSNIKRRRYLDPILQKIKKEQGQTYTYLYSRVFLRGTEYSGLVLRLTIIGSLILIFSDQLILNGIISVLFVYLIGFQLLPIYGEFDYMLMTQLYPVKNEMKLKAVQQLVGVVLVSVSLIFSLILVSRLEDKLGAVAICGGLFVESFILTKIYGTKRLKKMEKSFF